MSNAIRRRNKTAHQLFGATTFSILASVTIALTPNKASAFDIGGLSRHRDGHSDGPLSGWL